jgi:coenzyme F420-reducing hydrogenase beta subunit
MENFVFGRNRKPDGSFEVYSARLREIKKMNIKLLVTISSGVIGIPLAEIKRCHQESCGGSGDFSFELADISAGGLGLDGWALTVVRTEKGEELFSGASKRDLCALKP